MPSATCATGLPSSSRCSISWWKTRGRPVMQMISRKSVQTRLVHLWTRYQVLMVDAVLME
ncbi:Uncharacterised protein [Bordetella pertussis]|nr:Uncharacterised protein [Bordetella pertussis]CFO80215.1 Uncharacterised protein [Bordetella pertussis]CPL81251.1 Uncharacterised protein [Bordetella pertussis]CPO28357.1 Uncharacterised protein [Bordetella pertussis]